MLMLQLHLREWENHRETWKTNSGYEYHRTSRLGFHKRRDGGGVWTWHMGEKHDENIIDRLYR